MTPSSTLSDERLKEIRDRVRTGLDPSSQIRQDVLDLLADATARQPQEMKEDTRVAPSVPCDAPIGSTAERSPGVVVAAERTQQPLNEWRLDDVGALDDVVVEDVETFRLERMSEDHIWGAVYRRDGSRTSFDIFGERLSLTHDHDQAASKPADSLTADASRQEAPKAPESDLDRCRKQLAERLKGREVGSVQLAWRRPTEPIREWDFDDAYTAVIDALVTCGSVPAWCGDGTGCVVDMLHILFDRATAAEAQLATRAQEVETLKARCDEFKRIGQGFERDYHNTFEQSCINLQRAEKAEASLSALTQAQDALKEQARALIAKLDVIIPKVDGIIAFNSIRSGFKYDGPNLVNELAALRASLARQEK